MWARLPCWKPQWLGCELRPFWSRLLAAFLCSLFVVIRPVATISGSFAFLVIVFMELCYFPAAGLGAQIESTVMLILGIIFVLLYANVTLVINSAVGGSVGSDSVSSRVISALALFLYALLTGVIFSRLPRLRIACRITGFIAIWILTRSVGEVSLSYTNILQLGFPSLAAVALSLLSSLVLLPFQPTLLSTRVVEALQTIRDVSNLVMEQTLDHAKSAHQEIDSLQARLFIQSLDISTSYTEAHFELRVCRLDSDMLKPFVTIVERLRRQVSWGFSNFNTHRHHDETMLTFMRITEPPARAVLHAVVTGINLTQLILIHCLDLQYSTIEDSSTTITKQMCSDAQMSLRHTNDALKDELLHALLQLTSMGADGNRVSDISGDPFHREMYGISLFMISLLEVAKETQHALQVAESILACHEVSRMHVRWPRFSWAWLGIPQASPLLQDFCEDTGNTEGPGLTQSEAHEGLQERLRYSPLPAGTLISISGLRWLLLSLWRSASIVRFRVSLARTLRSIWHSHHLRYALKLAIGIILLSLPAFFPSGSSGRQWFDNSHGQWIVISFMYVLETETGTTWRAGWLRILGTISGAIYAYVAWLVCHNNPYALVAAVTLWEIPVSYFVQRTSFPGVGIVGGLTVPIVLFPPYLGEDDTEVWQLAVNRPLNIGIGILAALCINQFIFPRHARIIFMSHMAAVLGELSRLYINLSKRFLVDGGPLNDRRTGLEAELKIKDALRKADFLITVMRLELSLLPKPVVIYRRTSSNLRRVLDLLVGLRSLRQNIPRKETVTDVMRARRDVVSSIVLVLFACEHSFRSQRPLPQFLPSPRQALQQLEAGVKEHYQDRPGKVDFRSMAAVGLPFIVSFAEAEALARMADALEDLLEVTKALFGTADWWTVNVPALSVDGVTLSLSEEVEYPSIFHEIARTPRSTPRAGSPTRFS